ISARFKLPSPLLTLRIVVLAKGIWTVKTGGLEEPKSKKLELLLASTVSCVPLSWVNNLESLLLSNNSIVVLSFSEESMMTFAFSTLMVMSRISSSKKTSCELPLAVKVLNKKMINPMAKSKKKTINKMILPDFLINDLSFIQILRARGNWHSRFEALSLGSKSLAQNPQRHWSEAMQFQ